MVTTASLEIISKVYNHKHEGGSPDCRNDLLSFLSGLLQCSRNGFLEFTAHPTCQWISKSSAHFKKKHSSMQKKVLKTQKRNRWAFSINAYNCEKGRMVNGNLYCITSMALTDLVEPWAEKVVVDDNCENSMKKVKKKIYIVMPLWNVLSTVQSQTIRSVFKTWCFAPFPMIDCKAVRLLSIDSS